MKRSDDQIRTDSQLIDAQAAEHLVKPRRKSRAADGGIERKEAVGEASHLNIKNNHYNQRENIAKTPYLIIVIFFTLTQFLENKIYTQKTRKLRQNTQ